MWIPQNEQTGRAFCGPGVSMLWDYAETDPVSNGPGNLWKKLKRIVDGSSALQQFPAKSHVLHACASELPFDNNYFDAIVTDPPYYDNIYYTALADFFFAWKRLILCHIEPELFDDSTTDTGKELVSSVYRRGSAENAHKTYCNHLGRAIREAERTLKPDGIFALIYSHSSLNGWDALIQAYRPANLRITGVHPLCIERKHRPRAMRSEAVNTCIVFAARKCREKKTCTDSEDLFDNIKILCADSFVSDLDAAGWNPCDIGLAVYAHGVAMIANVSSVTNIRSDAEVLAGIENIVREKFPEFKIVKRKSL